MNVVRAFFSLSALTTISRLSGFVKVAIFAAFYGRSSEADIFMTIMILPDLLYRFLSEGLVASAAVPLFVDLRDDKASLGRSFYTLIWIAVIVGCAGVLILTAFSEPICNALTPGFSAGDLERMQSMWSQVSIYLVTGLVAGVMTALLNARACFAAPAVGPLLVNIAIILGTLAAAGGPVEKIATAVVLGSVIQVLWLAWLVRRLALFCSGWSDIFEFDCGIAARFTFSVFPVAVWISVLPFIPVYERYLLSLQPVGSVAALNYVEKLFNLPLGIISISLANVILPRLSILERSNRAHFLAKSFVVSALIIAPIVLIMRIFAQEIVEVVFGRGKFGSADVLMASELFKSYSLALLPVSLSMVLNRGFFAARNYFMPFLAGLTAAAVQFYLGARLVDACGVPGIGYAAAVAFSVQTALLCVFWVRENKKLSISASVHETL